MNGTLDDEHFDADGKIVFGAFGGHPPRAIALLPDGRIVVSDAPRRGQTVLWRLAATGDADPFPARASISCLVTLAGASDVDLTELTALPDGRFLGAGTITGIGGGTDWFVARFDANGVAEPAFGTSSGYTRIDFDLDVASNDVLRGIAVAADGRIAAVGEVSAGDRELGVAMLDANGDPVATFDGDGRDAVDFDIGVVSDDRDGSACFDPSGQLFVAGTVTDPANGTGIGMALLSATGALQSQFQGNGKRVFSVFAPTFLGGRVLPPDRPLPRRGHDPDDGAGARAARGLHHALPRGRRQRQLVRRRTSTSPASA